MTRVAIVYPTPVPYSFPVLELLAARDDLRLTVYYCRRSLPGRQPVDASELRFPHVFLPNAGFVAVRRDVHEVDFNPTLPFALERGKHDAVVVSGFVQPSMLLAIGWARARRRAYGIMSESHGFRARTRRRALARDALVGPLVRGAALLLPTSQAAADELVRLGAHADRSYSFPHVPDPRVFHPGTDSERAAARAQLGVAAGELLIAYVGRLVESKDVSTALAAAALLRRPHRFVVAGDGPLATELRAAAPPSVEFIGSRSPAQVAELLRAADVLLLPSRDEPFGTIVVEAAACGLPVVATRAVPAAHDLAAQHGAARLFDVGDVRALADELERLDEMSLGALRRNALAAAAAYTPSANAASFAAGVLAATRG